MRLCSERKNLHSHRVSGSSASFLEVLVTETLSLIIMTCSFLYPDAVPGWPSTGLSFFQGWSLDLNFLLRSSAVWKEGFAGQKSRGCSEKQAFGALEAALLRKLRMLLTGLFCSPLGLTFRGRKPRCHRPRPVW